MMRRNLIVAFKPIKSNSLALSELNHRMMMLNVSDNIPHSLLKILMK